MPASAPSEPLAIWDPVESLPRDELRAIQLERLRTTVARLLERQPLGASRLATAGISSADDVASLDDLARLPFSLKSDLRENYPFGLMTVPREELARLHASSGTHGKPTVVGYTRADLDAWTEVMARCMTTAGVRPGMLIHNANQYGLFTGGHGFHQGAERIGATVVPVSGGFTTRQATLLHDLGGQVLVSTPSYALVIAQGIRDAGIDVSELRLEIGLFGGEPWTDALREELEAQLGLKAMNIYGLSEMCGPGVAAECVAGRAGLHVQEDHFLLEVLDPESGEPVAEGEDGELVFTTLTKEALPMLRYRSGDIGAVTLEPCVCGRTTARLKHLRGRRDDMVIVRGVNLYPSNVEHILLRVEELSPHYQLVVERNGHMDELTVQVEPATDGVDRAALVERVEHLLREQTGIRIAVDLLAVGGVPRFEGKAVRVVDRR
jgi:phenylacetate-CoA ligase